MSSRSAPYLQPVSVFERPVISEVFSDDALVGTVRAAFSRVPSRRSFH